MSRLVHIFGMHRLAHAGIWFQAKIIAKFHLYVKLNGSPKNNGSGAGFYLRIIGSSPGEKQVR